MPKLSVISIAKNEGEFEPLRQALARQTFRDFEFVTSTKPSIPEAWNDAISRAMGEFLIFTETDARPQSDEWLEEAVMNARKGCVLKGLEIRPADLDLCNLICDASVFQKVRFDETFKICEDTELFAHLRKNGVIIDYVSGFPVVHVPLQHWRKTLTRGLRIGMYHMKIIYLHGRRNIDDINTRNFRSNYIHPVSNRLRIMVENALVLLGLFVGAIGFFPTLLRRRLAERNLKRDRF
jgi:glycosyltransferase involved in cell wall biosynthesis